MKGAVKALIITAFFVAGFLFINIITSEPSFDYVIDGDTQYINNSKAYISVTPHSLNQSDWVYFNFSTKTFSGDIDFVWGFNTTTTKPTKAEIWANYSHPSNEPEYGNVTLKADCAGSPGVNFGFINDTNAWCNDSICIANCTENCSDACYWENEYETYKINESGARIFWNVSRIIGRLTKSYYDWKDISGIFNSVNYDYQGMNKWWHKTGVPIEAGKIYTIRAYVDVPVSLNEVNGKYWFCGKPSAETIHEAVLSDHFFCLDPWYSSQWNFKKNVTFTDNSGGFTNEIIEYVFLHGGKANADCSDIRVTNTTNSSIVFGMRNCSANYVTLNHNVTVAGSGSTVYFVYYNNSAATWGNESWNVTRFSDVTSLNDGFEDGNFNANPAWIGDTASFAMETSVVAEGDYSVEMQNPAAGKGISTTITGANYSAFYINFNDVSTGAGPTWAIRDGSTYGPRVFIGGSLLKYHVVDTWYDIMSVEDGVWYFIEFKNINLTSDTYDIWVDEKPMNMSVGFSAVRVKFTEMHFRGRDQYPRVDNFGVDVNPEPYPTIALGSEESAPAGGGGNPLEIILDTPADEAEINLTSNFTFTPTKESGVILNCSLWTNESSWSRKEWNTTEIAENATNWISETFSAGGDVLWTTACYNGSGEIFATTNRTGRIDAVPPALTIISPVNISYDNNTIWFNLTGNDTLDWSVVEINEDGFNHTLSNSTGIWNYLNNTLEDGAYNATFWANDTNGNMNSSIKYFTINTVIININTLQFRYKATQLNTTYPEKICWYFNNNDEFCVGYNGSTLHLGMNTSTVTCDANNEGMMWYNDDTNKHYGCDGSSWNALY